MRTPDGYCIERHADDALGLGHDALQMLGPEKAFRINFVNVFSAGWARREPSAFGRHFHAADRRLVMRRLSQDAFDCLSRQFVHTYLLRGKLRQLTLLRRRCRRLETLEYRSAELVRQVDIGVAGIML